jgi:hypothetical protein
LAGLFGHGLVSRVVEGSLQEGLQVEYERFGRQQSPTEIRLSARPEHDGPFSIWIDHSYLAQVELQHIVPGPETAVLTKGGVRFEWHAVTREPAKITFYLQPHTIGRLSGEVRTDDNAIVRIQQFIYP